MIKKKVNEKSKKSEKTPKLSTPTGTESIASVTRETTGTNMVAEVKKIDKLSVGFPNEDMNQVVGKLNEIIEQINGN